MPDVPNVRAIMKNCSIFTDTVSIAVKYEQNMNKKLKVGECASCKQNWGVAVYANKCYNKRGLCFLSKIEGSLTIGKLHGGKTMDGFLDQLAEKMSAQDMIRANTAAEAQEFENVKDQVEDVKACMNEMKASTEQMKVGTQQTQEAVDRLRETVMQVHDMIKSKPEIDADIVYIVEEEVVQLGKDIGEVKEQIASLRDGLKSGVASPAPVSAPAVSAPAVAPSAELERTVAGLQENSAELRSGIAGLQENSAELRSGIAGLQEDSAELRSGIAGLQENSAELRSGMAGLRENSAELKSSLDVLQTSLAAVDLEIARLQERFIGHGEDSAQVSDKLAAAESSVAELKDQIGELKDQVGEVKDGCLDLKDGILEVKDSFPEIREGIAEVKAGFPEIQSSIAEVKAGFPEIQSGIAELKGSIAELKDSDSSEAVKDGVDQLGNLYRGLQEDLSGMNDSLLSLQDGLIGMHAKFPEIKADVTEVKESFPEIKASIAEVKESFPEIKAGIAEVRDSFPEIKAGIAEVKESFPEIKAGIAEVKDSFPEIKAGIAEVKESFPEIKSSIAGLQDAISAGQKASMGDLLKELTRASEKVGAESEKNAERTADSIDALKNFLIGQLDQIKQEQKAGASSKVIEEKLQALSDQFKTSQEEEQKKLEERLTNMHEGLREGYHKECVKVYRNVQAAFTEENERQTATMTGEVGKIGGKSTLTLVFAILAFVMSLGSLALQVLTMLKIL